MTTSRYGEAFESGNLDLLLSHCVEDVTLHSPMVAEPGAEGRGVVGLVLPMVFGGMKDVQVVHDLGDEKSHVVVFDTKALNERLRFSVYLEFGADTEIREIWLMARPLKALTTILAAVGRFLDESGRTGGSLLSDLASPLSSLAAATDRALARLVDEANAARV